MAGLWNQWTDNQGITKLTYTVITTAASEQLEFIHPRMPALLEKENLDIWLNYCDNKPIAAIRLLKPYEQVLEAYPVSGLVNNVSNNSPHCIEKVDQLPGSLFI